MINILPTDTLFWDSPDAGTPECLCSRCGLPIGENEVPVRAWPYPTNPDGEYRYHRHCQGDMTAEE